MKQSLRAICLVLLPDQKNILYYDESRGLLNDEKE